ncbi:hypothetical protein KHHGKMAE_1822 [Methylobacterium persicinum]|nr:hypothetical protein KHHGKMAE_1822 [Methylobacterium persicinum]
MRRFKGPLRDAWRPFDRDYGQKTNQYLEGSPLVSEWACPYGAARFGRGTVIVRAGFVVMVLAGFGPVLFGGLSARAQVRLDTVNTVPCAEEGGVCRMPYPTNVYFGVPGKTHGRPFPQGGAIPCNVQSFGDPAPNQRKACWYAPRIAGNGGGGYRNDPFPRRDDRDDDRARDAYRSRGEDRYRDEDRGYDRPRRQSDDDGYQRRRYRNAPDDE